MFDARGGIRARDQALAQVDRNANEEWKERALLAVEKCAQKWSRFIVDQVWQELEKGDEPANDNRAMGAVMRRAVKYKLIEPTEDYRPSNRVTSHRVPRRIWKSLPRMEKR
jgi:hypothetical protein|tara:strand:- start:229 stop:561 length:333 start_codon:yes stop_codon:yes gene_type:complete